MKNRILLAVAVFFLLAMVAWIVLDLFKAGRQEAKNPYDYGMDAMRNTDTLPAFLELDPLKPHLTGITCLAGGVDGMVFVGGSGGVEIFDAGGRVVNRFTLPGQATCMARLGDGNLAIGLEDHLEIWNPGGVLISAWPPADTASILTGVASAAGLVYVADAGRKVVYQYDLQGKLLMRIGEKDPVRKIPGFILPSPCFDVAVSAAGDLWVANTGRHRLEKYGADGSLLTAWGEASFAQEGFSGCCNPSHFALLPDGSFVTAEKGIERIKLYSPAGVFQSLVAGPESFDEGTRGLDVAPGAHDMLLVLDPVRNQVRKFTSKEKR